ncbi:GNAT family N-acetyltransferase [Streptomyces sp. H27-S2]|uniref:GNAT family N-acetyltransferase n=1 Tax=Streptomyces antarcticus TaxID=2996458 RepID=UPI002270A67C|nr:GNAT family N-acetyltransferase [Streptomyces sp. H27-S2]MCY0953004.1 GNAT family N-acetyltransferase [Streptomyces sp. H27-S2]
MTLPEHLTLKNPTDVPLDSLVRFVRSYEETITGASTCSREDILLETGIPGYRDNSWCLTDAADEVVAWAALTVRGGGTADCALTVLPGEHGDAAARALLHRLLNRADELGEEQDTYYSVSVGGVLSGDTVVPRVLEQDGFVRSATFGQYDIDLRAAPLPPVLPGNGRIRTAGWASDAEVMHALHLRNRSKGPKTESLEHFRAMLEQLGAAGGVALVLELAGRPAGYVLAQEGGGEGRVIEMGVAPASRGLGIGLALVTAVLAELRALGSARALMAMDTAEIRDHEGLRRILAIQGERAVSQYFKQTA